MTDQIERELTEILTEDLDLPAEELAGSSRLVEDLGVDSVALAIGVVAIEERLGVRLSERELLEASTVDDLLALVRSRKAAAEVSA